MTWSLKYRYYNAIWSVKFCVDILTKHILGYYAFDSISMKQTRIRKQAIRQGRKCLPSCSASRYPNKLTAHIHRIVYKSIVSAYCESQTEMGANNELRMSLTYCAQLIDIDFLTSGIGGNCWRIMRHCCRPIAKSPSSSHTRLQNLNIIS